MYGDDALGESVVGAPEARRATLQLDRAGIRLVDAGDDLGQGRFAGAVLADEAANPACHDLEVDAAERADRGEVFHQPLAAQEQVGRSMIAGRVSVPFARDGGHRQAGRR